MIKRGQTKLTKPRERYVTLFYGKLDVARNLFEYTNAGHPPPLLFRSVSQDAIWLEKGGPVIGLLPQAGYQSDSVALQPGDVLVLYTDGAVEAENQNREQYSSERLLAVVRSCAEKSAQEIVQALSTSVFEFAGTNVLGDDLTLVVLRVMKEASADSDVSRVGVEATALNSAVSGAKKRTSAKPKQGSPSR